MYAPLHMPCNCHWPSPGLLLLTLCLVNLFIFLDRGSISSNGVGGGSAQTPDSEGLVVDFNLSGFESGCIPAVYFVGLAIGAPTFGQLSKYPKFSAFRLIGVSLVIFGIGVLATGFANSYAALLVFRCIVGFGNGAVIALGPPLIDDSAPKTHTTTWLSIFYLCMPVGYAIGYIYGGAVGSSINWRAAFWIEAGVSIPFALWFLLAPAVQLRDTTQYTVNRQKLKSQKLLLGLETTTTAGAGAGATSENIAQNQQQQQAVEGMEIDEEEQQQIMQRDIDTSLNTGATTISTDTHTPEDVQNSNERNNISTTTTTTTKLSSKLNTIKESTTIAWHNFCSDIHTLFTHKVCLSVILALSMWNGFIGMLGWWGPKATWSLFPSMTAETVDFAFGAMLVATGVVGSVLGGVALDKWGNSMKNGLKLSAVVMVWGVVFCIVAFLAGRKVGVYWVLLGVAELGVFAVQAPANALCMWSIPPDLRPFAIALSEATQHILGDIPMPPALGAIQDAVQDWRLSLSLTTIALGASAVFFACGLLVTNPTDYREVELEVVEGEGDEEREVVLFSGSGSGNTSHHDDGVGSADVVGVGGIV